ncbi:MAG: hypothetical protein JO362_12385 [Streptomycetaceae bacterium]|nr:hypothetical protein [Streptomycetaceae bacterium]
MFNAGDKVLVVSCEDDPRAVGKTGVLIDEVPPGPLTQGRWTVIRVGWLRLSVLCHGHELQKMGR